MIPGAVHGEGESRADAGFSALFKRSLNPMLIVDDSRRFVDANPAACLLLRLPVEQLVGRRIEEVLSPRRRGEVDADWEQLMREGTHAGRYELLPVDRPEVEVQYSATANFRPGLHLSILTFPPDPEDVPERPDGGGSLTDRERQVMTLLAMGLDGPHIAEQLSISNPTVQTHVRNAMGRLGARTRAHAVALALTRGEIGF